MGLFMVYLFSAVDRKKNNPYVLELYNNVTDNKSAQCA